VGLEFDAQAYGEQLQRVFAGLLEGPRSQTFSDVTLAVHGEKVGLPLSAIASSRHTRADVFGAWAACCTRCRRIALS
jgi:hypothetical protein